MSRTAKNPLDGKTQEQIDFIMSKRPKDMTVEETSIYKRVKYNDWIARGKKRVFKKEKSVSVKAPVVHRKPISVFPSVDVFSSKTLDSKIVESEIVVHEPIVGSGKIPNWADVPELTLSLKEFTENRSILMSIKGQVYICKVNWLKEDTLPTISGGSVAPFFLSWPNTWVSIKYGFVRNYDRDAIQKEIKETLIA